jgi:hypothetical protein
LPWPTKWQATHRYRSSGLRGMERVQITAAAYSTIILHGAKYPSCPIIGLLIGYEENNTVIFLSNPICLSISLCLCSLWLHALVILLSYSFVRFMSKRLFRSFTVHPSVLYSKSHYYLSASSALFFTTSLPSLSVGSLLVPRDETCGPLLLF